jgi:prepilin-type N-terminal cleavage/methylation domain-containing protein
VNLWAKRRQARQDDGVTMIEMTIALVLVSVAVLGLLGSFSVTAAGIQKQQYRAKAERIALDKNEHLRLADYDSADLSLGTHTGTATAVDGSTFQYSYVVVERAAGTGQDGDIVKEIRTTVSWTGAHTGSITYVTAVAKPAADIGLPAGYAQSIRSMAITPAPSTVVDYNGYTATDIIVTLVLTGHTTSDVVHITWQDDRGGSTPTVNATSTNGYQWVANVGHGAQGIHYKVNGGIDPATGKAYYKNLTFTARTDTGLTTTSTLPVYGPTDDPPTITSFATSSATGTNDVKVAKGGNNQFLNTSDVTVSCVVSGLISTNDSVQLSYYDALGTVTTVPMKPTVTPVQSSSSTWTYTFLKTTTYFYYVDKKPAATTTSTWGCTVARSSDGGPAARTISVGVHT